MVALARQKRRVPPNVWRAARSLYASDPTLTLEGVAARFDLSLPAVRKRSSRERWRETTPEALGYLESKTRVIEAEPVPIVTLRHFRKAVQEEAVQLLCLLRQARRTAERDPIEAIRAITPTLERLGRIAERAFEQDDPPCGRGAGGLLRRELLLGVAVLPPSVENVQA